MDAVHLDERAVENRRQERAADKAAGDSPRALLVDTQFFGGGDDADVRRFRSPAFHRRVHDSVPHAGYWLSAAEKPALPRCAEFRSSHFSLGGAVGPRLDGRNGIFATVRHCFPTPVSFWFCIC